jgi:predicted transcriptional regulator
MANEPSVASMSTFSIRIPTDTKERIDTLARSLQRSRNFLLTEAVERYLEMQARQIAHIEEGLADLEAGRVHTHEEMKDLVREFERLSAEDKGPGH